MERHYCGRRSLIPIITSLSLTPISIISYPIFCLSSHFLSHSIFYSLSSHFVFSLAPILCFLALFSIAIYYCGISLILIIRLSLLPQFLLSLNPFSFSHHIFYSLPLHFLFSFTKFSILSPHFLFSRPLFYCNRLRMGQKLSFVFCDAPTRLLLRTF